MNRHCMTVFFRLRFCGPETALSFSCHILLYRFSKFCTAKIKKYGECCQFVLKIIHEIERNDITSMKEYNDLKQRLMKIGMKNFVYMMII